MSHKPEISREDGYRLGHAYGQLLCSLPHCDGPRRRRLATETPADSLQSIRGKALRQGVVTTDLVQVQHVILSSVPASALLPGTKLEGAGLQRSCEQGIEDGISANYAYFRGSLLARRRIDMGLTQEYLSAVSGYSVATVCRIEAGKCTREQLNNYQRILRKIELAQVMFAAKN